MAFTLAPSFPVPKAGGTIDPLSQYGSLLGLGIGALLPMLLGNRGQQQQQQPQQNQQQGLGGLLSQLGGGGTATNGASGAMATPNGAAAATPQGMPGQGQALPPPAQPQGGGGPNPALIQLGMQRPGNPLAGALAPNLSPQPNLQQLIQQRLLGGGNLYNMNPNSSGFGTY